MNQMNENNCKWNMVRVSLQSTKTRFQEWKFHQFALFALTNLETKEGMTENENEDESWIAKFQKTGANLRPIRIYLVGTRRTGAKTSLINRFIKDIFNEHVAWTVEISFFFKRVEVDGVSLRLQIWGLSTHTHNKRHHHLNKWTTSKTNRYGRTRNIPKNQVNMHK